MNSVKPNGLNNIALSPAYITAKASDTAGIPERAGTPLIYKQMSLVMRDIGAIAKDQKNQAQGFKFRGIDQFVNALYPALTKHGVFMAPRNTKFELQTTEVTRSSGKVGFDKNVTILMEYVFYAEDGSSVVIGPVPAEGLDSGDKATNKALSAALKYALIQTFSIPTEDMAEADLESPEIAAPARTQLREPNPGVGTTTGDSPAKTAGGPSGPDSGATPTKGNAPLSGNAILEKSHKLAVSKAQVAVAKKALSKAEILSHLKTAADSITDAVSSLDADGVAKFLIFLEGKINGK